MDLHNEVPVWLPKKPINPKRRRIIHRTKLSHQMKSYLKPYHIRNALPLLQRLLLKTAVSLDWKCETCDRIFFSQASKDLHFFAEGHIPKIWNVFKYIPSTRSHLKEQGDPQKTWTQKEVKDFLNSLEKKEFEEKKEAETARTTCLICQEPTRCSVGGKHPNENPEGPMDQVEANCPYDTYVCLQCAYEFHSECLRDHVIQRAWNFDRGMSIASNQTHFDNIQHYVQQHLIQAPCCRSTNIVRGWSNIKVKYDGIYFEIQQKKSSSKKKLTKLI